MNRTLERRAEGIKSYFETNIKKCELRESRLRSQLDETSSSLLQSQSRCRELEERHDHYVKESGEKLHGLEAENSALLGQLQSLSGSIEQAEKNHWETLFAEEKARYDVSYSIH